MFWKSSGIFREPFAAANVYTFVRREDHDTRRGNQESLERTMIGLDYQYLSESKKAGHQSGERATGLPAHPLRL
jgi:hypothetical protein